MEKITTNSQKFICPECQNENEISADAKVGDIIECEFCGIEFEIAEQTEGEEFVIQMLEEEK